MNWASKLFIASTSVPSCLILSSVAKSMKVPVILLVERRRMIVSARVFTASCRCSGVDWIVPRQIPQRSSSELKRSRTFLVALISSIGFPFDSAIEISSFTDGNLTVKVPRIYARMNPFTIDTVSSVENIASENRSFRGSLSASVAPLGASPLSSLKPSCFPFHSCSSRSSTALSPPPTPC